MLIVKGKFFVLPPLSLRDISPRGATLLVAESLCVYIAPPVALFALRARDIPLNAFTLRVHEGDKIALVAEEYMEAHPCPPRERVA